MGDHADMAMHEAMDMEDLRFSYRVGAMSDLIAHDHGIIDELGFYPRSTKPTQCKYCGVKADWKLLSNGKWRLHNGDTPHTCKQYLESKEGSDGQRSSIRPPQI